MRKIIKWCFPGIILIAVLTLANSCERKEPTSCEPDSYELNNSLASRYELTSVMENSASFTARISSKEDLDFYSIKATEGTHNGIPGTQQYFKINIQLINPSGKDYDLYLYSTEGSLSEQSINRGDEDESIEATWEGTVGFDDSYTFGIEVRPYSGDWSCVDYTLSITMSYSNSPW